MKIVVCSSMVFAKELLELRNQLENLWHQITLPPDIESFLQEKSNEWSISSNISNEMKSHYHSISESDAILVFNNEKNWIPWYVWGATLMELAVAFYLNKKIYLAFTPPSQEQLRYVQEILLTNPIILDWDFTKIQ